MIQDAKEQGLAFLQGRAIWLASKFGRIMPDKLRLEYVDALVANLRQENEKVLSVLVVRALQNFLSTMELNKFESGASVIVQTLCVLIGMSKSEFLLLLVETLTIAVKISEKITAIYEEKLVSVILDVWSRCANDVFAIELVQDLFKILSENCFMAAMFQTHMFPLLMEAISPVQLHATPGLSATALDLFSALIENAKDNFSPAYTEHLFPRLITILHTVDDDAILQNGQETLKHLVSRNFNGIVNLQVGQQNGLELILNFVAKLLDPSRSESSAIFVGELVTTLIKQGDSFITANLMGLLTAVIQRLACAQMPAFIQTLILIFCNLILNDEQGLIDFLSSVQVNGKNALEVFIQSWCQYFPEFHGHEAVETSVISMTKLALMNDARLDILVQGDPEMTGSKRI